MNVGLNGLSKTLPKGNDAKACKNSCAFIKRIRAKFPLLTSEADFQCPPS